jgi:hypothetical protein
MLDCCGSQEVCVDSVHWTNGYVDCGKTGLNESDGCTTGGLTCEGYVKQGFCQNQAVVDGKEWTVGGSFNHPELNCCACGKKKDASLLGAVL